MEFSRSTLELFVELIKQATLPATMPNLVEMASTFETAKNELQAALQASEVDVPREA